MKNSRIDRLHSADTALRVLAMVVNVAMEIVHQIDPTRMVGAMEDTTHQLRTLQAMS